MFKCSFPGINCYRITKQRTEMIHTKKLGLCLPVVIKKRDFHLVPPKSILAALRFEKGFVFGSTDQSEEEGVGLPHSW